MVHFPQDGWEQVSQNNVTTSLQCTEQKETLRSPAAVDIVDRVTPLGPGPMELEVDGTVLIGLFSTIRV